MKPILLEDRRPIREKAAQSLCQTLQQQIQRGACQLVDLLDQKDRACPILFRPEGNGWRVQQYVGLFQLQTGAAGETAQVVITSRFDTPERPYFLWRLMECFLGEAMLVPEDLNSGSGDGFFDAMLAAKLAIQLQNAWKKGGLRAYRTFARNDSRAQGQPDIPRHIRENLGQNNGRIACRTRTYSLDNPWNALFLQAAEAVRRRRPELIRRLEQRQPEFGAALRALAQSSPGWAGHRRAWLLDHTRTKISNPIYRDYEPARRTARAILRRLEAGPVFAGADGPVVTGVFLDIDALWEIFLQQELLQAPEWVYQPKGQTAWEDSLELLPDFLRKEPATVLDAKNRTAWGKTLRQSRWRHINDDVYQVAFYMRELNCPDGGVIFPVSSGPAPAPAPLRLNGSTFWRIPVPIPRAGSYSAFCQKLEAELDRLRRQPPIQMTAPS